MKLIEILQQKQYNTDKWNTHHYVQELYDPEFTLYREKEINFLEIGVLAGESMKLWSDYFVNAKNVIGMDTFEREGFEEEKVRENLKDYDVELWNMNSISGDQVRYEEFGKKYGETGNGLDIVIDDGHHFWESQVKTFHRFAPFMNEGGIYIVEDIGFHQEECIHEDYLIDINAKNPISYIKTPKLQRQIPNFKGFRTQHGSEVIGIVRF